MAPFFMRATREGRGQKKRRPEGRPSWRLRAGLAAGLASGLWPQRPSFSATILLTAAGFALPPEAFIT